MQHLQIAPTELICDSGACAQNLNNVHYAQSNTEGIGSPLVVSIIVTCGLILFLIILAVLYLCRMCIRGTRFKTKIIFCFLLLLYLIGREVYYILQINWPEGFVYLNDETIDAIRYAFFLWSSTCFYSAFMVLSINWTENMMTLHARSVPATNAELYAPKRFIYWMNAFIHALQLILVIPILLVVSPTQTGYKEIHIIQNVYHCALCFTVVVMFWLWRRWSSVRIWNDFNESKIEIRKQRMLFFAITIICVVILLKVVCNIVEIIMIVDYRFSLIYIRIYVAMILDIIPFFVAIGLFLGVFRGSSKRSIVLDYSSIPNYNTTAIANDSLSTTTAASSIPYSNDANSIAISLPTASSTPIGVPPPAAAAAAAISPKESGLASFMSSPFSMSINHMLSPIRSGSVTVGNSSGSVHRGSKNALLIPQGTISPTPAAVAVDNQSQTNQPESTAYDSDEEVDIDEAGGGHFTTEQQTPLMLNNNNNSANNRSALSYLMNSGYLSSDGGGSSSGSINGNFV